MKVNYYAKNYEVTPKFKDVLERKLEKLDKFFDKTVDVKVNCTAQNKTEKLEITITSGTYFFRSEVSSDNMYNNIDLALPKLEKQITKVGNKARSISRKMDIDKEIAKVVEETVLEDFKPSKLAKTKRFELLPLSVDDAEAHMEALGHNFYVYLNRETNEVNILYRRNDKQLGIIEVDY